LRLLLGGQVLPGLHAVEHLQLLLWWQAGKMLQSLAQDLLSIGWQPTKSRIILQSVFLLCRGEILVLT
jgi:hypothetical protein